jgi:hypothetical protein
VPLEREPGGVLVEPGVGAPEPGQRRRDVQRVPDRAGARADPRPGRVREDGLGVLGRMCDRLLPS